MTYTEFGKQVFAAISVIQDSLDQFPGEKAPPVPASWTELQAILRRAAEEIMICTDLTQVVATLREDLSALRAVELLTTYVEDADLLSILRRAFHETHEPSENLPGQPLAAYLLELSKMTGPPHMRKR